MSGRAVSLEPGRGERALRGVVVGYVFALVAVPLVVLVVFGLHDGPSAFVEALSSPTARAALSLSFTTGLVVGALNAVLGTAAAWVLFRYRFPGRAALSALVDLPLAIPTLVAGLMIAVLYGPGSLAASALEPLGVEVIFAPLGIVLALLFVTLPFVVRAVEPVLEEVDPAEVEASQVLGAGPIRTFRTVFLPAIVPAALSGGIRSFGRALGEFGSVVVVAGNIPQETLTAPVYIFGEIESGAPRAAAAASVVLLAVALALHALARCVDRKREARRA
jgi:sulfate transport system permease protein